MPKLFTNLSGALKVLQRGETQPPENEQAIRDGIATGVLPPADAGSGLSGMIDDELLDEHHRELDQVHADLQAKARDATDGEKPQVHPLACVDPSAELGAGCVIGPFCVVGPDVVLGKNNRLMNGVTITGRTTIGDHNLFFPNCVIGAVPQDKKYKGEPTRTEIGSYNCFREAVTIHAGTVQGGGVTSVGDYNLLMVNVHLGHDCRWGSHTVVANNVMIAGHVQSGDGVAMMGGSAVHHYTTLGDFSYIAGYAQVSHDVPPFVKIFGQNDVRGLNTVGLKRAGFAADDVEALEKAVRRLYPGRRGFKPGQSFAHARQELDRSATNGYVRKMLAFLRRRDQGVSGRFLQAHH